MCHRCRQADKVRVRHCSGTGEHCSLNGCHNAYLCERCGLQWTGPCPEHRHGVAA